MLQFAILQIAQQAKGRNAELQKQNTFAFSVWWLPSLLIAARIEEQGKREQNERKKQKEGVWYLPG